MLDNLTLPGKYFPCPSLVLLSTPRRRYWYSIYIYIFPVFAKCVNYCYFDSKALTPASVLRASCCNAQDTGSGASGEWRLRFFDVYGEDWITKPIEFKTGAEACPDIITALESIPNDVIDSSTATCTRDPVLVTALGSRNTDLQATDGNPSSSNLVEDFVKFNLNFNGNPGGHKTPQIVVVDAAGGYTIKDGSSNDGLDTIAVYDTGITGEFFDFFGQKCGVTVSITNPTTYYTDLAAAQGITLTAANEIHYGEVQRAIVASGTDLDIRKLKECLGDSNAMPSDNVGVENWDFGGPTKDFGEIDGVNGLKQAVPGQYPHMVKLVDTDASEYDGGVYTIMVYHEDDDNFVLSAAVDGTKTYEVCCKLT